MKKNIVQTFSNKPQHPILKKVKIVNDENINIYPNQQQQAEYEKEQEEDQQQNDKFQNYENPLNFNDFPGLANYFEKYISLKGLRFTHIQLKKFNEGKDNEAVYLYVGDYDEKYSKWLIPLCWKIIITDKWQFLGPAQKWEHYLKKIDLKKENEILKFIQISNRL